VIYTGLALLIGLGLVGFGVGSVGGGSIFESVSKEGGTGGRGYAAKIAAARKRIKQNPKEAAAWATLTEAQLHEAAGGENYESETERYTAQGKEKLRQVARSWSRYLQLDHKPSVKLAKEMVNIFGIEALNEPGGAIQALGIVIEADPHSAALYSQLADYSYLDRNFKQGDLAAKQALALVPKIKRPLMESEFERLKNEVKRALKARSSTGSLGAGTGQSGSTGTGQSGSTGTGQSGGGGATGQSGSLGAGTGQSGSTGNGRSGSGGASSTTATTSHSLTTSAKKK
jgi:hypothetical protein